MAGGWRNERSRWYAGKVFSPVKPLPASRHPAVSYKRNAVWKASWGGREKEMKIFWNLPFNCLTVRSSSVNELPRMGIRK